MIQYTFNYIYYLEMTSFQSSGNFEAVLLFCLLCCLSLLIFIAESFTDILKYFT